MTHESSIEFDSRSRPPTLRRALPIDASRLAELSGVLGYPADARDLADRLRRLLARADDSILVAELGPGDVVGWIHGEERELLESGRRCEIVGLVVAEAHRGRGVGRALVEAVEHWARERGLGIVTVRSNVVRAESHSFYDRLGYVRTKTQHAYRKELALVGERGRAFESLRSDKVYEMSVPAPRERVFPLLCPKREHEWLPYWKCEILHSLSGVAELGCVFRTDLTGSGEATWVVTRYDRPERVQYAVFQPGSHTWTIEIALTPLEADRCRLSWRHTFTGLTEAGNRFVSEYSDERHRVRLAGIERCLVHFLKTGTMLEE